MARYDGSAPLISAAIVTQDGERYPLWIDSASSRGGARRDRPFLAEVTVKLNLGNIPILTARLTPPLEDAVELLDSFVAEWANDSVLAVQLGYAGASDGAYLSPLFEGLILKPDVQIGTDVSVTLNAQGLPRYNYSTTGGVRALRGNRASIIRRLLTGPDSAQGTAVTLDTSEVDVLGADSPQYQLLHQRDLDFAQGGRTDWQLISQLLWEARCTYAVAGRSLKVIPTLIASARRPQRTFALGGYAQGVIGPVSGVFPILSVSSPHVGVYLPARSTQGFRMQDVDPTTGRPRTANINDASVRPSRTAQGTLALTNSAANPGSGAQGRDGPAFMPGDPANQRQTAQASAAYDELQTRDGVKLEIETIGIPDIVPGEVIRVVGLGRRLDTNYVIFEARHTAGSGFTTSITAVANVNNVLSRATQELGLANLGAPPRPQAAAASAALLDDSVEVAPRPSGRPGARPEPYFPGGRL